MFALILVTVAAICFLSRQNRAEGNSNIDVREKYTPSVQVKTAENTEPRRPPYSKVIKKQASSKGAKQQDNSKVVKLQAIPKSVQLQDNSEVIKLQDHAKFVKQQAISSDSDSVPPPLPPLPKRFNSLRRTKPHEIVAYDCEISKNFLPYAPPPPVHGLASTENHKLTSSHDPYNIQVESLADYDEVDSIEDSTSAFSSWRSASMKDNPTQSYCNLLSPNYTDSYYDTVESIQEGAMEVTCSQQLSAIDTSFSVIHDGHYQSPRRNPLQHRISDAINNTYTEHLEPSMLFRPSISSDESEALPYGPIYASPKTLKRAEKPLEISYHNVSDIQTLGVSRFGDVVLAATVNLSLKDLKLGDSTDESRSFLVAIKKLKLNADWELKNAFFKEIKCMMRMKHANVVRLLGVCSQESPPFSMVEYMENGDLQEFLLKQKLVPDNTMNLQEGEATPLILLYMAVQVASGMRFLASRKFIHRDLAARNCLVGREFVVKIAEFGMSRSLYDAYYFRIQGQLILPIRWMAYESFYGKFSTKSDVWAFGVTLWEIYCMAECKPYSDMSNEEVISNATKGPNRSLLEKPSICPDEVFDVMKRCWVHEPSMRADFEEIYSRLFLAYISKSQKANV